VSAAVGGTVTDCGCEFYKHRYCVSSSVLIGIECLEVRVPSRLLLFVDVCVVGETQTSQLKMEVFYTGISIDSMFVGSFDISNTTYIIILSRIQINVYNIRLEQEPRNRNDDRLQLFLYRITNLYIDIAIAIDIELHYY
jgi:hypothetical protein